MSVSTWRKSVERLLGGAPRTSRKQFRSIPRIEEFEKRLTPAAPVVLSIDRLTPATQFTNAASVVYNVPFDQPVAGVDANDFQIASDSTLTYNPALHVAGGGASY